MQKPTPQIIFEGDKPVHAVLKWEEWEAINHLLPDEDIDDEMRAAQLVGAVSNADLRPAAIMQRIALKGENPVAVYRQWRNLTQGELAQKAGVSLSLLSKIEAGHKALTNKTATKLAVALQVDFDELTD